MKLSALFIALVPLLGSPVIHAETTAAPVLENRAAQGDITTPGGARRLTGDQTEALRASLINKPAKNVILLIGDGMGDSEITVENVDAGGSGAACSASVLNGVILPRMEEGAYQKVLFMATGALLSPTTTMQKESIPGIAHAVAFERRK